jgi:hypothetical protein
MLDVGTTLAPSRLLPAPDGLPAQPEGSYLVPIVDPAGDRWVTEVELSRCEAACRRTTPRTRSPPWAHPTSCYRSARLLGWPV